MSATVTLRVRTPPADWGSQVCLTGSCEQLSNWGEDAPLQLRHNGAFQTITLTLPADAVFEYKYVTARDGRVVRWEQPAYRNRRLCTGGVGSTLIVDDGVVDDDGNVSIRLIPARESDKREESPAKEVTDDFVPPSCPVEKEKVVVKCVDVSETVALAQQLERAYVHVERLRVGLGLQRGDVKAVTDTSVIGLCEGCVSEGGELIKLVRKKVRVRRVGRARQVCMFVAAVVVLGVVSLAWGEGAVDEVGLRWGEGVRVVREWFERREGLREWLGGLREWLGGLDVSWGEIWGKILGAWGRVKEVICREFRWLDWCGEGVKAS